MDFAHSAGLSSEEVRLLQLQFGKNSFYTEKPKRLFHILKDIVREPMFIMLLAACLLYFILAEIKEGAMMLVAMVFVAAISVFQEMKSTKALDALKKFTESKIKVLRNGVEQIILSEELVPGDILILEEGSRIPADAILLQQNDLTINESILTGESVAVEKNVTNNNQLFQGTIINSGKCIAKVIATGNNTQLGKLGKSVSTITSGKTLLQQQINRFVKTMAGIGLIAFATVWLINYLNTNDVVNSLLFGLTLAMSVVPEEIPVAFSSFMALGAYHMSKFGIIARQPITIENLGAVSVLCLDKTGTITQNKMQLKTIYDFKTNSTIELNGDTSLSQKNILRYARFASEEQPFDAMEKAILQAYTLYATNENDEHLKMIHEYPLSGQPPMMTHVWAYKNLKVIAAKGAVERIIKVCKLNNETAEKILSVVHEIASKGYRVIAVSSATHTGDYPELQDDFNWSFEGLLGLYDPPKQNIETIFKQCYSAGIQIKMITGDYAETARNIASQTGIENYELTCTGDEIMQMDDETLRHKVKTINIFARMFPDAKLKVINALKTNGEIVAMTGDGVNDGPALKSSHIGIAMGSSGTEIAKEAADLIITDDNLEKITIAVSQGRKIYSNLKKAVRYILSIHVPIILTASLPLLLGWKYPNIFTPIHIIFLELIMGPTCSVFFEREPVELNIMHLPPRERKANMFSAEELLISLVQGIIIASGLLVLYHVFMNNNYNIEYTRTMVFTTLILCNVWLTFINRSFEKTFKHTIKYKNNLVPVLLSASALFLFLIGWVGPVQQLFQLTTLQPMHYFICIGTSLICTAWFEVYKMNLKQ